MKNREPEDIGVPPTLPERLRRPRARRLTPPKFFARLWPEPNWEAEAEADPWGTALRYGFRGAVGAELLVRQAGELRKAQAVL